MIAVVKRRYYDGSYTRIFEKGEEIEMSEGRFKELNDTIPGCLARKGAEKPVKAPDKKPDKAEDTREGDYPTEGGARWLGRRP